MAYALYLPSGGFLPRATVGVPWSADVLVNPYLHEQPITATLAASSVPNATVSTRVEGQNTYITLSFTATTLTASNAVFFTINMTYPGENLTISPHSYGISIALVEGQVAPPPPPPETADYEWLTLSPVKDVAFIGSVWAAPSPPYPITGVVTDPGNLPSGYTMNSIGYFTATFTAIGEHHFTVQLTANSVVIETHIVRLVVTESSIINPPPPPPPPQVKITKESYSETEWLLTRTATDSAGALLPTQDSTGTVNYDTGSLYFPPEMLFDYQRWSSSREGGSGEWIDDKITDTWASGAQISVTYQNESVVPTEVTETLPPNVISINLTPYSANAIIPGTVQFKIGNTIYTDVEGVMYHTPDATGYGTPAGTIDYASGYAVLNNWVAGSPTFTLQSLATLKGQFGETEFYFRTTGSPLRPGGFQIAATDVNGELLSASADLPGAITGTAITGNIDVEYGLVDVRFGAMVADSSLTAEEKAEEWYNPANVVGGNIWQPRRVIPQTTRYNCVVYAYLPLDADILGIDAVRLPSDGRVPIYRNGQVVMVIHPLTTSPATPALNGTTGLYELSCGRTRIAWVKVLDATGAVVTSGYTLDRATGIVSWATLSGLVTPVTIQHTVGDLRLITDVQIDGTLTLARPLTHAYPADESLVAACLIHGDRRARVSAVWDQASWDSTWTDALVGSAATATLNTIDFPITVTNEGCDTDRWLLRWTSTTNAELISEKRGLVWSGSYPAYVSGDPVDIAPINPRTRTLVDGVYVGGVPYLTLPQRANGGGWSAGNVVRINTIGAIADFWIARSIAQSDEPLDDGADGCELYALGNIDRP